MVWQQYKKELLAHRGDAVLTLGGLIVLHVFLATRIGKWTPEVVVFLSILPIGFTHLWVMWSSLQLYRREWRENTHYLMLSLPVRAWKITVPKLAALMTGTVAYSLIIFAGVYFQASGTGLLQVVLNFVESRNIAIVDLFGTGMKMYGLVLASFIGLAITVQLAFLLSRLFHRFQGALLGIIWVVQIWLIGELSEWLGRALNWLPGMQFLNLDLFVGDEPVSQVIIDGGPLWAAIIIGIGLFVALNTTLERAVEAT